MEDAGERLAVSGKVLRIVKTTKGHTIVCPCIRYPRNITWTYVPSLTL